MTAVAVRRPAGACPRVRAVLRGRPGLRLLRGAGRGRSAVVQETAAELPADRRPRPRSVPRRPVAADRADGSRDRRRRHRRRSSRGSRGAAQGCSSPPTRRLGDLILRAFILRRTLQTNIGRRPADLRVPKSRPDARRLRDFVEPQPDPAPAGSTWRTIPRPRTCCVRLGIPATQTPGRDLEGHSGPAQPEQHRAGRPHRAASGADPGGVRPCRRWRGPGGLAAAVYAASEGLSTVVLDAARHRRPGRHVLPDRELPGVPRRHPRRRAGRPCRGPGPQVRRRLQHPRRGDLPRTGRRLPRGGAGGGGGPGRSRRAHRHRRALPTPRHPGDRPPRGQQRLLRRDGVRGPAVPTGPRHRRGRRQLRGTGGLLPRHDRRRWSTWSSGTATWRGTCPATWPTASRSRLASRSGATAR